MVGQVEFDEHGAARHAEQRGGEGEDTEQSVSPGYVVEAVVVGSGIIGKVPTCHSKQLRMGWFG